MFQKAAVIVLEELTGGTGGDKGGEGEGLVSAKRVPARTATERSRRKSLGFTKAE
jgi:hypothetical protein